MKIGIRHLVGIVLFTLSFGQLTTEAADAAVVRAEGIAVTFSEQGEIISVRLGPKGVERSVRAGTVLTGCQLDGPVRREKLGNGGIQFTKLLVCDEQSARCTLREQFVPVGNSVRWEISIVGTSRPWSTAIQTRMTWSRPDKAKFWTAWSGNPSSSERIRYDGEGKRGWDDPLETTSFCNKKLTYGSHVVWDTEGFSIPIVTVLEDVEDIGITLALSPEDLTLDMKLLVTRQGGILFSRTRHRIAAGRPVRFAMDLVAHPADWRAGLGWMVERYPANFDPPNPLVHEIAGCGAYSSHAENIDVEKLHRMAFRVNWRASFDFPYMGMFLPPIEETEEWISGENLSTAGDHRKIPMSIKKLADYARRTRERGFYELNYFNVTEFGANIWYPAPPRKAKDDTDLWKDPNDFLHYKIGSGAILLSPGWVTQQPPPGKPYISWERAVVMDPGEPAYQQFLLEQAQRHIEALPASSGISIDRMDWLKEYNIHRDDGVSWVNGKPARSLVFSWHDLMAKLGPMMHGANKVIYGSPHYRRLDLMRHLDGVFDEYGKLAHSRNLSALLCLRKPMIAWTIDNPDLRKNPDGYFQAHLHMGAYLTAPIAGNDHSILPDPETDKHFIDYGPLLDAMRGRKWVLKPHVVEALDDPVKVNLFEIPGGYVMPVTFGGERDITTVVLRGLKRLPYQDEFRIEALHPGAEKSAPVRAETMEGEGILKLHVPLARGCAMVKLLWLWIQPDAHYFTESVALNMGTTIGGAAVHYTLCDDADPTQTSPRYEEPIQLSETTPVKAAVFKNGKRVGAVLKASFTRIPASAE